MTPIVTTARFSPAGALSYDAAARHIDNFKFSDPTHGVLKRRYDVVFLLKGDTGWAVQLVGRYDDTLHCTGGTWRFHRRVARFA